MPSLLLPMKLNCKAGLRRPPGPPATFGRISSAHTLIGAVCALQAVVSVYLVGPQRISVFSATTLCADVFSGFPTTSPIRWMSGEPCRDGLVIGFFREKRRRAGAAYSSGYLISRLPYLTY